MDKFIRNIKNCIDEKGNLTAPDHEIEASIKAAESLCESLLGATISVRGKRFIIRMLEIYYGGVKDDAHDWYRTRFVYKTSKFIGQTEIQAQKGLKLYLSSMNVEDTYTRMDIVVGEEKVPVSFLLRSVWDENFSLIGSKKGNPNIVLRAMGIRSGDHGAEIKVGFDPKVDICIENTRDKIHIEKNLRIHRQERINIKSDFEEKKKLLWNFSVQESLPHI